MKIVSTAVTQAWEASVFASGTTVEELMAQAVDGCFHQIKNHFPNPGRALFLCGKGHNGNDGLWLARRMEEAGWNVNILLSHDPAQRKKISVDAVGLMEARGFIWPAHPALDERPTLVIDGLLGLGVRGEIHGPTREILDWWKNERKNRLKV